MHSNILENTAASAHDGFVEVSVCLMFPQCYNAALNMIPL